MSKKRNPNNKKPSVLNDLVGVNCEAVTAFRIPGTLLARSVSLTIVNGVVVGVKDLTRAENTNNIAISRAVSEIWKIIRVQSTKTFLGDAE